MFLEKLIVPLVAEVDEYVKGLDQAKTKTDQTTKDITESWKKKGESMMKIGGVMSLGITTPIIAGAKEAINYASDLNETESKTKVVFGENAAEVLKFGENSAKALGMSKNAALSAASTYGNLFTSMGMSKDASADLSMGLVQNASDLASFNNLDPSEVLDKLRAGLTGETEPLKSLGININAATVEQKALTMGLWDGEGAISASAKAQATYALIQEQTKNATGDFARTSDGLANSQRIAKAEFENASASLGQTLLPIMTQAMQVISKLITWFNNLSPATKTTIVSILAVAAAIGPLITIIGGLITTVTTIAGLFGAGGGLAVAGTFLSGTVLPAVGAAIAAVGWPIIALIAIVGGLIFIWTKYGDDIKPILAAIESKIVLTFRTIVGSINTAIDGVNNLILAFSRLTGLKIPTIPTIANPIPQRSNLSSYPTTSKNNPDGIYGANGIDNFRVPSGYENDNFPVHVSTGEYVNVTRSPLGGDSGAVVDLLQQLIYAVKDSKLDERVLAKAVNNFSQQGA